MIDSIQADKIFARKFKPLVNFYTENAFETLNNRYSEPHRFYHNKMHIANMLQVLDQYEGEAVRPEIIMHSIYWHDYIYQTQHPDGSYRPDKINVAESAAGFLDHSAHMPGDDRNAINAMILTTQGHVPPISDEGHYKGFAKDAKFFLDADLASMASPWDEFWDNTQAIRQEFAWIDQETFCLGRAEILEKFLGRDSLYFVVPHKDAWNIQAKANLRRSIGKLKKLELQ